MSWDFLLNPLITLLTLFYQVFGNNIVIAISLRAGNISTGRHHVLTPPFP